MRDFVKTIIYKYAIFLNKIPFLNRICTNGCSIELYGILFHCHIVSHGRNNVIKIGRGGVLKNCKISINGDNNVIEIAENVHIIDGDFCIEDSNNKIFINEKSNLCGKIHLAVTEGTEIRIGKECLFSSEIVFRTGDSHSILDMEGNRINFAKNIVVGDKVWIGHRVLVTKNVVLPKGTIVGTGAVVTRSFDEENIVIAGNPAKIIKENVQWKHER